MSNILKGIINEVSPHNYDSDWDYQDAVARSGKSRSSYRSQEDDTFDSDVAYSRKMYQLGQQQKAAKEKAQRDSDHNRLATGTNEDITEASNSYEPVMIQGYDKWLKLVSIPNVDRHAYKSDITAVTSLGDVIGEFNTDKDLGYVIKKYAKGVSEGLNDPWGDQGNFAGDKSVNLGDVSIKNIQVGDTVKYFGQPSKVIAMSKDRKYSRITISKGMGTVTQDVLTRDLQQLGQGKAIEENDNIQTRMRMDDYYNLADAIQEKLRQAIQMGDNELVHKLSKERADLDTRVKKYGLMPESQLDEISNEKLAQYKTAAALDAGKADKEGDYKRGDKRFSGIVKATKKQFANDTKKSGISQGINEFAPIKPPTAGAFGGNKDYGQPNTSRYIGGNKFVVGTTNNYVLTATIDKWGLEWDEDDEIWFLDSPGAAHIADASEGEIELPPPREQRNQIHDLVTDYLNARNSADLQKVAAYYGHSDDGEMATNESSEAPRFNSKQEVINHFVKSGKSAAAGAAAWERGYRGSSKKPIELRNPPQRSYHDELDDKRYASIDENLGDQLKSNSLNALVQAKLAIEQQRQAEIEAWKRDFEKNTIQKAQQGLRREFEPTPVAQPGEKHSVLKARLAQLNNAIQKQELVDKLVDRLERKGLLTPAMQNDTDTRMHVRYGAKDNYESLNKKLDNAIQTLQSRLNVRKISGLKEVYDERDEYDNPRQGRDYGKGNLFVDPGSNEFKKEVHPSDPNVERGRPKNLKGVSKALPADAFGRTTGKIPDSARPTSKEDPFKDVDEDLDENLHKWFQEKWVRFGPDGKIRGDCARGDDSEGKPKCLPQSKAQNLGKAGRASAASRKRREDPNPERSGKAINVNTKKKTNEEQLDELKCWSGYHRVKGTKAGFPGSCAKNKTNEDQHSESCPHCGGEMVSEELMNEKKDACYYKVKSRYKVWPSAYASGALVKCRKKGASNWGTGGKSNESIDEGWQEESQDLEDWSKEVNKKLYRAHENQRRSLAIQLSKLEQKHFGSELTNGPLTNIVFSTLQALNKGQMVHYDPQSVGQMPFGNIVGDDARIIASSGLSKYDVTGYRGLQRAGIVDTIEQFLHLRDLADNQGQAILKYANMPPVAAWMQFIKDIGWSKNDMNEEVQSKTDDKLLAYYAQRKAEKQKQQSQSQDQLDEKWTKKYKDSINCSNPKGFSQKAHCAGKQKNESSIMQGLNQIDEDWKKRFGAAALTSAMALGSAGAQARVTPDGQGGFTGGLKPAATATDGLVHADSADRQAQTITVGGKEYGLVEISPTDIRPRSGQRIVVPQAVLGERGIGNYMGILVGNRVFVISK